ncbi:MAG: AAA family ATPase [Deinococcales bacterium]
MARSVRRIEIYGYKSIVSSGLPLTDLNILIGANGAGKSNFISAFQLFNHLVQENLQTFVAQQGGASRLLHFGRKTTEHITFKLSFGQNGYSCTLKPTDDDSLFLLKS